MIQNDDNEEKRLAHQEDAGIRPADIKALNLVQKVLDVMYDQATYNVSEVCRWLADGDEKRAVAIRRNYYNALQSEYVRGRIWERQRQRDAAWLELTSQALVPVIDQMRRIASGEVGYARDHVAAGRFLWDMRETLKEQLEEDQLQAEGSRSERFLSQWFDGDVKYSEEKHTTRGKTRVTRTVTVEQSRKGAKTIDAAE